MTDLTSERQIEAAMAECARLRALEALDEIERGWMTMFDGHEEVAGTPEEVKPLFAKVRTALADRGDQGVAEGGLRSALTTRAQGPAEGRVPVSDIQARLSCEQTMRDMARKRGDHELAKAHGDRAQVLTEVLAASSLRPLAVENADLRDRLARYERGALLRSEIDAPEGARRWKVSSNPYTPQRSCYWLMDDGSVKDAPNFRPDAPPGATLPIIEDT